MLIRRMRLAGLETGICGRGFTGNNDGGRLSRSIQSVVLRVKAGSSFRHSHSGYLPCSCIKQIPSTVSSASLGWRSHPGGTVWAATAGALVAVATTQSTAKR